MSDDTGDEDLEEEDEQKIVTLKMQVYSIIGQEGLFCVEFAK